MINDDKRRNGNECEIDNMKTMRKKIIGIIKQFPLELIHSRQTTYIGS